MKILLIAPQPFFQERGTPIAVDILIKSLIAAGCSIDLLTFNEGQERKYPNVNHYRIPKIPFIKNIRPGFSCKKLICDVFLFFKAFSLIIKNKYTYIHAVEESAFMAMVFKFIFKLPYTYDMDSSLAQQLVEKMPFLNKMAGIFNFAESLCIAHSASVVCICEELAKIARKKCNNVFILPDISMLNEEPPQNEVINIRKEKNINGIMLLYIGNLEKYQGIDLLLNSMALTLNERNDIHATIIGGKESDIEFYTQKAKDLKIEKNIHFIGPRPLCDLSHYLKQADILVSPRIKGKNTPMKIYSYLDSGKPVLATDILSHTQVMDNKVAFLTKPNPEDLSKSISILANSETLREEISKNAKEMIQLNYTINAFENKVNTFCEQIKVLAS